MVVVLFWTFVYDMLIYYKTWIYQCLIKQVKSPSKCSLTPNSVRIRQSGRAGNQGVTSLYQSLGLDISGKSLRLLRYLHRMCWPNADVFVLFIV